MQVTGFCLVCPILADVWLRCCENITAEAANLTFDLILYIPLTKSNNFVSFFNFEHAFYDFLIFDFISFVPHNFIYPCFCCFVIVVRKQEIGNFFVLQWSMTVIFSSLFYLQNSPQVLSCSRVVRTSIIWKMLLHSIRFPHGIWKRSLHF